MNGLIFPGQGSQSVGMAKFLFDEYDVCKKLFNDASEAAEVDFEKMIFEGPAEKLNLTENTQPALVLASSCYLEALKLKTNLNFSAAAGHSLGEYSALVACEVINFKDAIRAVKARGKFMQEAVPVGEGAMYAVMGLEPEAITKACLWAEQESCLGPLSPANFNAPGQIVISGAKDTATWLIENFKPEDFGNPRRYKFIPLKVSAPFHCKLMQPAQEKMQALLSEIEFKRPTAPVVQNVSAKAESDPDRIKQNLIEQISAPVLWTDCILEMKQKGIKQLFEMGPGCVLTGLVKKIDSEHFTNFNMQTLEDLNLMTEAMN